VAQEEAGNMKYETVIGLEVHAQLLTESKIFCTCSTKFGAKPNTNICPVCTGQPGVLPVLNKKVVEFAVKTGLALGSKIAHHSIFARKNYFYPDLPKNYQVSQYELPIATDGKLEITVDGKARTIGITRVHLEEDAGKLIHIGAAGLKGSSSSLVDFNRTGVPLMEIVSEPDIRSPEEAKVYMQELRSLLVALGVCDGNMEEGSLRCDANISLRPAGQKEFGVKAEVKNMNSFKAVQKALAAEVKRQTQILEEGGKITQETRLYDDATDATVPMRSKEEAHDYRYFPEPDLVPVEIDKKWIDEISSTIGEVPRDKKARFMKDLGLPEMDAEILTSDVNFSKFFEESLKLFDQPKEISNWLMGDVSAYINDKKKSLKEIDITPSKLVELIKLVGNGIINRKTAKEALIKALDTGKNIVDIIKDSGATQISDKGEILKMIADVINKNPKPVADYKAGKENSLFFLMGQVMKASQGRANPEVVKKILIEELKK
jgi:aspartyl-tRNA(Asn)/glutamyl-tRNA(Gln) amidotransferase subunit B